MLNWIRRWFINRSRAIFRYWNGRRYLAIDPLVALRALKDHPEFDLERDTKLSDAGDESSTQLCLAAARAAFHVVPFDGKRYVGLTETETLSLLGAFGEWTQAVKKNISPQPISCPPIPAMPETSNGPEPETTSNTADSCSTSDAPNSDEPPA